eukprot:s4639_g8.t1
MDRFLVRRPKPDGCTGVSQDAEASPKRQRTHSAQDDAAPGAEASGDPQKIISWNVNGLAVQLRNNWSLIKQFLENEEPDVLCLQEVRLPAAGPKGCKRGDGQKRSRREAKYDSAQEKADWDLVQRTLVATYAKTYSFHWHFDDDQEKSAAFVHHLHMLDGEPADMRGQPGFTEGERRRFKELLVTGRLVDSYRRLHPSDDVPAAAGPYFTWRGHPPVHQTVAKYHGKGSLVGKSVI